MWLYLPKTSSPSAPATADSTSPSGSPSPEAGLWLTVSGKPTQRPSSWPGWKTRAWSQLLFGTILNPSTAGHGAAWWIRSLQASLARTFPTPDAGKASSARAAASSSTSCGWFAKWDPATCSWRTSALSLDGDSTLFSGPFPKQGSMRNGACSRRRRWERPTCGSGCSSWPTPQTSQAPNSHSNTVNGPTSLPEAAELWRSPAARDYHPTGQGERACGIPAQVQLAHQAEMWPTPNVPNGGRTLSPEDIEARGMTTKGERQVGLENAASHWSTPRASPSENRNTKHSPSHGNGHGRSLAGDACLFSLPAAPTATPGNTSLQDTPNSHLPSPAKKRLNVNFSEWLMGLPPGWTDAETPIGTPAFTAWETASCQLLEHLLYASYGIGPLEATSE